MHPDVLPFPREIYEFPTLASADGLVAWRAEWLSRFTRNAGAISEFEPLVWLANGMLNCLQAECGKGHMLFKSPHMRHLGLFDAVFPDDILIMVVRDGRDVIASSRKTFKNRLFSKNFRQLAVEWRQATQTALAIAGNANPKRLLWRYEDLVREPEAVLRRDLPAIGLDVQKFPFERLKELPVIGSSVDERDDDARWNPTQKSKDFNPIGRWQSWPERRKLAFARMAGPVLSQIGYQ